MPQKAASFYLCDEKCGLLRRPGGGGPRDGRNDRGGPPAGGKDPETRPVREDTGFGPDDRYLRFRGEGRPHRPDRVGVRIRLRLPVEAESPETPDPRTGRCGGRDRRDIPAPLGAALFAPSWNCWPRSSSSRWAPRW